MLKKLVSSVTFYAFATLNLIWAYRALKREYTALVETDKAENKFHYVGIRLARGDYNFDKQGFETLKNDYKFYDVASMYNANACLNKNVKKR